MQPSILDRMLEQHVQAIAKGAVRASPWQEASAALLEGKKGRSVVGTNVIGVMMEITLHMSATCMFQSYATILAAA